MDTNQGCGMELGPRSGRPINSDQVAWLMNAIERALPMNRNPAVSRAKDMQMYGLLYEIMEVANLSFEDDAARWNGTPPDVRGWDFRKDNMLREHLLSGKTSEQEP